jgi:hypothetical protein
MALRSKRPRGEREHGEDEGPDPIAHFIAARHTRCSCPCHIKEGASIRPFASAEENLVQARLWPQAASTRRGS